MTIEPDVEPMTEITRVRSIATERNIIALVAVPACAKGGPVPDNAIIGVDMALCDIEGKGSDEWWRWRVGTLWTP